MQKQYELKDNSIEILGSTSYTDEDGQTASLPRRLQIAFVKRIYNDDGSLETESQPHRPGPIGDDDLDKLYTINPDSTQWTAREIWTEAENVSNTTLI